MILRSKQDQRRDLFCAHIYLAKSKKSSYLCKPFVITIGVMNIPIVRIGNSRGIRLPKNVLDRYQLSGTIELELKDDCIVLKASPMVREGWAQAFQQHASQEDEVIFGEDFFPEDVAMLDEMIGDDILQV